MPYDYEHDDVVFCGKSAYKSIYSSKKIIFVFCDANLKEISRVYSHNITLPFEKLPLDIILKKQTELTNNFHNFIIIRKYFSLSCFSSSNDHKYQ